MLAQPKERTGNDPPGSQGQRSGARRVLVKFALAVKEIHHRLYEEALAAVKANQDLPERKVYVCQVYGNTVYDEAPETCPICNTKNRFDEIA